MLQRPFEGDFGLCTLRGNKLVLHIWYRLTCERLAEGGFGTSLIDWCEGGIGAHNVYITEESPYGEHTSSGAAHVHKRCSHLSFLARTKLPSSGAKLSHPRVTILSGLMKKDQCNQNALFLNSHCTCSMFCVLELDFSQQRQRV